MIRFVIIGLALVLFSVDAQASVIYQLVTPSTNTDGAVLNSGFFETDGTFGSFVLLGDILTDYEINITEGLTNVILTPGNSTFLQNTLGQRVYTGA